MKNVGMCMSGRIYVCAFPPKFLKIFLQYIFQNLENCPLKSLKSVHPNCFLFILSWATHSLTKYSPENSPHYNFFYSFNLQHSLSRQKNLQRCPTKNIFYSFYLLSWRRRYPPLEHYQAFNHFPKHLWNKATFLFPI